MTLTQGTILGDSWRIEKFLGEGACAKVYSVSAVNGSSAGYEVVAKVIPLPTGKKGSKGYKEQERICNTLHFEYSIYTGLLLSSTISPRRPAKFYGDDLTHNVRYLIIERMDKDLMDWAKTEPISIAKLGDIGVQMVDGLRWIHSRGFLFVDVKPENFMLKGQTVYVVDFGLVQRIGLAADGGSFAGTPSYCSLAVHGGAAATPKDEIESVGYVLLGLLCQGNLPWENASSFEATREIKAGTDIMALASSFHCPEIAEIILDCRNTTSSQRPDYDKVNSLLRRMASRTDSKPLAKAVESKRNVSRRAISPKRSAKPHAAPREESDSQVTEQLSPLKKKGRGEMVKLEEEQSKEDHNPNPSSGPSISERSSSRHEYPLRSRGPAPDFSRLLSNVKVRR
eukprot:gene2092-2285_t